MAPGYGAGMAVNGTGCTSDQGPPAGYWTLYPNGTWFGFIRSANHESWGGGWIEFDMGCFYEGWAADVEADHDDTTPFRDIYVRNDYGHLFNPDVESGAKVWWVDAYGDHREVDFSDWPEAVGGSVLNCPGRGCAVWIYVRGGVVYRIVEQTDVTADGAW